LAILHTPPSEFDKHGATLRNNNNGDNLLTAHLRAGLYSVKASQLAFALTASTADVLHDWHFRLGHLNVKDVMRLSRAGRIEGQSSVWKRCKRFHLQFLHLVKTFNSQLTIALNNQFRSCILISGDWQQHHRSAVVAISSLVMTIARARFTYRSLNKNQTHSLP